MAFHDHEYDDSMSLRRFAAFLCFTFNTIAYSQTIVIDGELNDWRSIAPVLVDAPDDALSHSPIDLGEVRITHDDRFVHLLVDVGRNVNLQGLPDDVALSLLLDVDGNVASGATEQGMNGVDVMIDFSPRKNVLRPGNNLQVLCGKSRCAEHVRCGPDFLTNICQPQI
jgi:hypothetical protein